MKLFVGYQLIGGTTQLEFHTHREFEIYYFHEGDCAFQISGRFYEVQPGDILLIDGANLHKAFVNQETETYRRSVIHFEKEWLLPVLKGLDAVELLDLFSSENGHLYRIKDEKISESIHSIFKKMHEIYHDSPDVSRVRKLKLYLTQMLIEIDSVDRDNFSDIYSDRKEKLVKVEEISQFITDHYQEKLSLAEIASSVNISKSYLSHLFKEVTGMTVMDFLMGYRLTQARFYLTMETSLSISEVAGLTGFESDAHFSRFFKKHTGLSPLRFRQQESKKALDQKSAK